jgi:hypothetical protein
MARPQLVLDLASRRGSELRMFKHVQQNSLFHPEHFAASNKVKHLYLIDGFLAMATAQDPVALYGLARSMFELSANYVLGVCRSLLCWLRDKTGGYSVGSVGLSRLVSNLLRTHEAGPDLQSSTRASSCLPEAVLAAS